MLKTIRLSSITGGEIITGDCERILFENSFLENDKRFVNVFGEKIFCMPILNKNFKEEGDFLMFLDSSLNNMNDADSSFCFGDYIFKNSALKTLDEHFVFKTKKERVWFKSVLDSENKVFLQEYWIVKDPSHYLENYRTIQL